MVTINLDVLCMSAMNANNEIVMLQYQPQKTTICNFPHPNSSHLSVIVEPNGYF